MNYQYPPSKDEIKKPPLSERIKAVVALLLFVGCILGSGLTHDRQWQLRFAVGAGMFLTTMMFFPAKAMDDFGVEEDEEEEEDERDK